MLSMSRKTVVYYPDVRGQIPALKCLLEEQGEALRRPVADYLGHKLYELRPKQLQILYAFVGPRCAVILHAFRKKTGPVPAAEQRLAQSRLADFVRRYEQGLITWKG